MNKKDRNSLYNKLIFTLSIMSILFLSGCTWFTYKTGKQVTFPDPSYKLYKPHITGSSYGWKFLMILPLATPNYANALSSIWEQANIPVKERRYYELVNLTENWGTSWTAIIIGQNYLKLTADVVENKNMPKSWYEYDRPASKSRQENQKVNHWYDYKSQ